jgi:hypothetical protein
MGRLGLTYLDHDGDRQTVSFEGADMTAANFDAQVTEQNAVVTAIDAITLGTRVQQVRTAVVTDIGAAAPVNPFAQTNIQWIALYEDTSTGNDYTTRIGTADLSLADTIYNGAPALNVAAGGAGEALKTAWDAYVLHDGNPTSLTAVYFRE